MIFLPAAVILCAPLNGSNKVFPEVVTRAPSVVIAFEPELHAAQFGLDNDVSRIQRLYVVAIFCVLVPVTLIALRIAQRFT